jgi:hypothetical protein
LFNKQVDDETLYTKEEWGETALRFNFQSFRDGTCFEVMGEDRDIRQGIITTPTGGVSFTAAHSSSSTSSTSFKSAVSRPFTFTKKNSTGGHGTTFGCKVIIAQMEKKKV